MSKDQILNQLGYLLWTHFPDEPVPNGPYWHQRPYLDAFFDLCIQAYNTVHHEDVRNYVNRQWEISRKHRLPTDAARQIEAVVIAWGEWQFAYRKLVADEKTVSD